MRHLARAALVPALALVCVATTFGGVASGATNWIVVRQANSAGEGSAQALPSAPTGVTATCTSPTTSKKITVSWSAVSHATAYGVYDSTTSATGAYSLVTSVTTTTWTPTTALSAGNYWYKVTASIGTNWTGVESSATVESTINTLKCVQP